MNDPLAMVVVALVVAAAAGWIARTVKRVPQDQRLLVERLGVFTGYAGRVGTFSCRGSSAA